MAVQKVNIEYFLQLAKEFPVIDVRSPGEFSQAHIPGAYNLPLFTDEERRVVGTAYKQESRKKAIKIGLEFFGKKMVTMVEQAEKITGERDQAPGNSSAEVNVTPDANSKTVLVHCWRGGMRSAGVAWLLDLYGFKVYTLVGGYKVFRSWVLDQLEKENSFTVIGGFTGSGKTLVLDALKKQGEVVIDLEDLACHKGSAFGNIGMPPQPTQEMFENKLAVELSSIASSAGFTNEAPAIWVEDESQRIGTVNIPLSFWNQMRNSRVIFLKIPFEERLNYIIKGYGSGDKEKLIDAIIRIQKRLGGLETKTAINLLLEDNIKESFRILLKYYDKYYLKGLHNRDNWSELVSEVDCEKVEPVGNAVKVLEGKIQKENV